jgi:hypothetical protein
MATRNVAMTIPFTAWDTANNVGKTGDAVNITPRWVKDGIISALTVPTVTELDAGNAPGLYSVDIDANEADCNIGVLHGISSSTGISIIPVQIQFERLPDFSPTAAGGVRDVSFIIGDVSAAVRLAYQMTGIIAAQVVSIPAANQVELSSGNATNNYDLTNMALMVVAKQGVDTIGQIRRIESYVKATRIATLDRDWDVTPEFNDVIHILGLIL